MKRSSIIFALLVAVVAFPASAFDFGLLVDNTSTVNATDVSDISLDQENQALLWLSLPIGSFSSLYASAIYEFEGDFYFLPSKAPDIRWWSVTAGRVEWEGFLPLGDNASLAWSVGRVPFTDYSARIISGLLDGAKAVVSIGGVRLSLATAYTGLTFKDYARIAIDAEDVNRLVTTAPGWPNDFATQHIVASLGVRLIELVPLHDLGLDAWAQFDLEPGTATHTQYIEPFIEGRAGKSFRWRLWGAAELGEDPSFFYAMAAGASLRLSLPEAAGLHLVASGNWAGGDYDASGPMRAFKQIRAGTVANVASMVFSDILGISLDASLAPVRGLSLGAGGTAILKPGDADIYRGAEASGRISLKPVNDVSFVLSGGAFFPDVAGSANSIEWTVTLNATLSL